MRKADRLEDEPLTCSTCQHPLRPMCGPERTPREQRRVVASAGSASRCCGATPTECRSGLPQEMPTSPATCQRLREPLEESQRTSKRSSASPTSARTESKDRRTASARTAGSELTPRDLQTKTARTQVVVEQLARQTGIVQQLRRLEELLGRVKARVRASTPQFLRVQLVARDTPGLWAGENPRQSVCPDEVGRCERRAPLPRGRAGRRLQ